ncbi:hypothetical protein HG263_08565 [Pseudoalteromonas sp. JBTF-M23]|uniref:Uncharacterized protein n=1 Tax=Pseudoalteromonas caenipelagi TaxID=2726988 RepID=A0A849VDF3_9GAMM|nr:hypothetical protein [Pseudoalteromonas caenipelagi]NOU50593.1 hypothetical protein [Pseudoalteromonas caenipelagi]
MSNKIKDKTNKSSVLSGNGQPLFFAKIMKTLNVMGGKLQLSGAVFIK